MPDGHPVLTYGPFVCRLNIDPIPVRMPVYVTSDPHFGTDFILGRKRLAHYAAEDNASPARDPVQRSTRAL